MTIDVPRARNSTQQDISDIDQKNVSPYVKRLTTRQFPETLMDIYVFDASESFISNVTDKLLPQSRNGRSVF